MSHKSYGITNVFYGCIINKNSESDTVKLHSLFETLKKNLEIQVSDDYTTVTYPEDIHDKFISVGYSYNYGNSMFFGILPPKGPIPLYTTCALCNHRGPQYHNTSCEGSDFFLIINDNEQFKDKIKEKFPEGNNGNDILYKDLFPPRGIQMLETNKISRLNFPNVMELKYMTSTDNVIVLKISKDMKLSIINVPYDYEQSFDKFSRSMYSKLAGLSGLVDRLPSFDPRNNRISSIKGMFKYLREDQVFNMYETNEGILKQFTAKIGNQPSFLINKISYAKIDYSYNSSIDTITMKFVLEKDLKATVMIRNGGSVQMFVSFHREDSNKILTFELLESIRDIIVFVLNKTSVVLEKTKFKGLLYDTKIMNTYVVSDEYSETRNTPPQPNVCRNQLMANLKTSYVRRPVPFSFSLHKQSMKGLVLEEQGVQANNSDLTINNKSLYVPCCTTLTGAYKETAKTLKLKFEQYSRPSIADIYKSLDKFLDKSSDKSLSETDLKIKVDDSIKRLTSTKQTMFRRLMYGFPNDIFEEDRPIRNNVIAEGTLSDKFCGVYVPGTQPIKFGGNGTMVRDSRVFKGLFDIKDPKILLEIVKMYCETKIKTFSEKLTPIHRGNVGEFLKNKHKMKFLYIPSSAVLVDDGFMDSDGEKYLSSSAKSFDTLKYSDFLENPDGLQMVAFFKNENKNENENKIYYWYNEISDDCMKYATITLRVGSKDKNIIEILTPDSEKIPFVDLYKDKYLFVPASVSKIVTEKAYRFVFNHFLDESKTGIIPNQPFLFDDTSPNSGSAPESGEFVSDKLNVVFNSVDVSDFSF